MLSTDPTRWWTEFNRHAGIRTGAIVGDRGTTREFRDALLNPPAETRENPAVSKKVSRAIGSLECHRVRLGTGIAHICDRSDGPTAASAASAASLSREQQEFRMMSLVRLLGFTNLSCGCVTGHYRELATNREITYVEEKGSACDHHDHRRNHTLAPARFGMSAVTARAS
jgi:hypothetical protein